ncbi:MAG: HAD family hydrolase [Desulfuromonas sp.]|nr:MAG: HAD family hydrolase [Desulfuromonas sp.]
MNGVAAVIFDCDGVMFESSGANIAYYNKILSHFSYPPVLPDDHERAHLCHTASSPDVLRGLMKQEDVAPALDFAAALDYREFIPQMTPEAHLKEALASLSRRYPLAVATNRGRSIEPILEHFNFRDFFSVIVTSHDVERPKPAPDMLLLAAEKLGVAPDACLFIGDSDLDRRAAEQAGIAFAGYGKQVESARPLTTHLDLLGYFDLI